MKILFILPEYYPHSGGGISTYYLQYIKALQSNCDHVKVIVGSGSVQNDDSFNYEGIEVEYLKPAIYRKYLGCFTKYDLFPEFRNNLAAAWAMWEQAKKGDGFDIIECVDFGLGFAPWLLKHDKPVAVRLHGSSGQIALHESTSEHILSTHLFQSAEMGMMPLADALISHSAANANFWNGLFGGEKTQIIYPVYASSVNLIVSVAQRKDFGLVTARVQKWKGAEELCRAMNLTQNSPLIKWFGRDMYFDDTHSTLQHLKVAYPDVFNKKIRFEGVLPQNEISQLQQQAKFGLVPSTWDMFNFTTLEFMARGTPVICSEGAGSSELIEHGKNGFKYPANDVKALASLIEKVNGLAETELNKIARASAESLKVKLNPDNIINTNLALYQQMIMNFKVFQANAYLEEMYSPSEQKYTINKVLDKQALKALNTYFFKRLKSKLLE